MADGPMQNVAAPPMWDSAQPGMAPYGQDPRMLVDILEQIAPALGGIARMLQVDEGILRDLSRSLNVVSTHGSMFGPTNTANVLFNRQMGAVGADYMGAATAATTATQQNLLKQFFTMTGAQNPTASAQAEMDKTYSPMRLAAQYLTATGYQMPQLQTGLLQAAQFMGIGPMMPTRGTEVDRLRQVSIFKEFSGQLTTALGADIGAFSGLRGEALGGLTAAMAKAGKLDFTAASTDEADVAIIQRNKAAVDRMSRVVAPLQELFGEAVPKLLADLDRSLGVSAIATFTPEQLQQKALNLKHLSQVTGISPQLIREMTGVSRQYLQGIGQPGFGADAFTNQAVATGRPLGP